MDHNDKGTSNNNIHENNISNQNENSVDAGRTSFSQQRLQSNSRDLNNTQYLSSDSDVEDYGDYTFRSDSPELTNKNDVQKQERIPLIPTEFTSIREAIQNFTAVFESRFFILFFNSYFFSFKDMVLNILHFLKAHFKKQLLRHLTIQI